MDWLTFISSLVGSLAWPITVIAVALFFRKAIKETLARPLRRLKAGPLEAEWEAKVVEALVDVAESPETDAPPTGRDLLSERLHPLAQRLPAAAVMAAYAEIEETLRRRLALAGNIEVDRRPMSARQMARQAQEQGVISPQTASAVEGATVLRNLAAHGRASEVDRAKALDYLTLADAIVYAIDAGSERPQPGPETPARS